jgi:phosphoribosylglycinamide formyltransferase 1
LSDPPVDDLFPFAVMVSGAGTNLQALIDDVHLASAPTARCVLVVASKEGAPALARAEAAGIPTRVVALSDHGGDREARDAALAEAIAASGASLVVMAGWMSIVTGVFLGRFPDRVINLHPSLLPSFAGMHAIEEALAWGVRATGVTVHFAEEQVDGGPPILQEAVPVLYGDTVEVLRDRIRPVEHRLLVQAVSLFAQGRVRRDPMRRRQVAILRGEDER